MKRLIIICEGETEQEFCQDVLSPYFLSKEIAIEYPTIKKSNGGIVKWNMLKRQIQSSLKQDRGVFVSTFIDLYGLPTDYPDFDINNIEAIEQGMKKDIDADLNYRFIPYIQRYEFECFLFASLQVFTNNFKPEEADFNELEKVIQAFPENLEDINNSPDTAPSKRLMSSIKGYHKIVYGTCLASEVGLTTIRQKCPRFNNWIIQLENI